MVSTKKEVKTYSKLTIHLYVVSKLERNLITYNELCWKKKYRYVLHNIFADFCHILLILIDLEALELVGVSSKLAKSGSKFLSNSRIFCAQTIKNSVC